jgi:hypothetical protein
MIPAIVRLVLPVAAPEEDEEESAVEVETVEAEVLTIEHSVVGVSHDTEPEHDETEVIFSEPACVTHTSVGTSPDIGIEPHEDSEQEEEEEEVDFSSYIPHSLPSLQSLLGTKQICSSVLMFIIG